MGKSSEKSGRCEDCKTGKKKKRRKRRIERWKVEHYGKSIHEGVDTQHNSSIQAERA